MISQEAAHRQADTVYRRLLAQGRPEADARRDAERWVMGNHGVEVKLAEPSISEPYQTLGDWLNQHPEPATPHGPSVSVNFSPFANATSAASEDMADLCTYHG